MSKVLHGDCLELMLELGDASMDMILCDLPYGITQNFWDKPIDLNKLWEQYERIIKPNGAIVLHASMPFTAELVLSNPKIFRYSLIWRKLSPTGFLNAKKMPLRSHEDILVFYKKLPTYNPQMTEGHKPVNSYTKHTGDGTNYGRTNLGVSGGGSTQRYPTSVLTFSSDRQKSSLHPTQKPLKLAEWLIATYTNEGDVVLDNCAGSGTTLLAARNLGRSYIGIEQDAVMVEVINERLAV